MYRAAAGGGRVGRQISLLIFCVITFTALFALLTNKRLLDPAIGKGSAGTRELLRR